MAAKEHNTQDLFNVSRHKISVTKVCGDECVDKITEKKHEIHVLKNRR